MLIAFSVPLTIFLLPIFRTITLTDASLGAETYTISLFILGFLYFIESCLVQHSKRLLYIAGMFLALAAYMKASLEIYMRMFACLLLLAFLIKYSYIWLQRRIKQRQEVTINNHYNSFLKKALLVFTIF